LQNEWYFYGMVKKTVTATPFVNGVTPSLVVSCTDNSVHWSTETLPNPVAQQLGFSAEFSPVTVAEIPISVGSSNPQSLVKIVAVTVSPSSKSLSLMFRTKPIMVASTGMTTVLVTNVELAEEGPSPTQSPSLICLSVAK
jgi:hypothetical protein